MLGNGYDDNSGSLTACGNDEWCCQSDVEDGRCNCYAGVGIFSLTPGEARTIIGVEGLSFTSTNFLPSTSPPFSYSATSALQPTYSVVPIATTSSRLASTATDASASSSDTLKSTHFSTTLQPSKSSKRHASTSRTTLQESKSSKPYSVLTRTIQVTPALTSTDASTETSALSSSSPTNSNVTTAASPSYLSTHKTGVGVGTAFGGLAALALIFGIIWWCTRRKASEKGPPVKTRVYRRLVSPSQILGPPNPDYSDVPPLPNTTPYTRQSNADINNGVHPVSITRAPGSGHLGPLPNPHPYQRSNNNSSSIANLNVSNSAFRQDPSVPPSSTRSSGPLLNTNPGASQVGYYGEAPTPHPYSPQQALRDQSNPLIPPTRLRGPTVEPRANQPYTIFHTAADSLAQGIGTPPPRYSPRRPNRSVPAWSPESVGTGNNRPSQR